MREELWSEGRISMAFELQSPVRVAVYMQATKSVTFALSEHSQAVPALWEELTGRQGCVHGSGLCLVASLVAELGREA